MNEMMDQMKMMVEDGMEFVRRMGLKVREMKRGYVELMVPLEGNTNHIGTMYAGALFTLAEIPGGAMFLTSFDVTKYYPVVKEMTLKFKKPVLTEAIVKVSLSEEEIARISQEVEEKGKSTFVLTGQIYNAQGELAAESLGTYQLRLMGT